MSRNSCTSASKIPQRDPMGLLHPIFSSQLPCCKEPHLKVTSQTHPNLPHSRRAGCLTSGSLASLGARPLTLHSVYCSMGEGRREEEENRDSELHSEIYGVKSKVGGRANIPAKGLAPAKRPFLGPKRHRGGLKHKNSQPKKNQGPRASKPSPSCVTRAERLDHVALFRGLS